MKGLEAVFWLQIWYLGRPHLDPLIPRPMICGVPSGPPQLVCTVGNIPVWCSLVYLHTSLAPQIMGQRGMERSMCAGPDIKFQLRKMPLPPSSVICHFNHFKRKKFDTRANSTVYLDGCKTNSQEKKIEMELSLCPCGDGLKCRNLTKGV
jgi:hypothetical protein